MFYLLFEFVLCTELIIWYEMYIFGIAEKNIKFYFRLFP